MLENFEVFIYWPWGQGVQRNHQECSQEIGNANGPAMPCKTSKKSKRGETPICVYLGSQWIHKNAYGRNLHRITMRTILQEKGQSTKNTKVELYSEVTLWRMTSSWRSICLYPGKNGRCSKIIGMSQHLDSSTTTQMAKIMVQCGRPSRSSRKESVRSSFGRTVMGEEIWENPIETWLGENSKLGMSLCSSWKRFILICVCGWHKTGWKETKSWSDVESTRQRNWFGRTNIFHWSCILGMHSTTMRNKQRYCWQLQNHVKIQKFRRNNWEITMLGKSVYFFVSYNMESHAKKCVERYCELANETTQTTLQSINSMHRWPSFQIRILIRGRIVKSTLSNCSKMRVLGTYWTTRYSLVSEQSCTIDHKMD